MHFICSLLIIWEKKNEKKQQKKLLILVLTFVLICRIKCWELQNVPFFVLLLYTFNFICTKIMLYLECSLGLVVVRGTCNVWISVLFVWKLSSSRSSSSSSIERQIDPVGNTTEKKMKANKKFMIETINKFFRRKVWSME